MKKLFFIAAMATFAIGAATAQQVYRLGEDTPLPCSVEGLDCGIMVGTDIGYTVPASSTCPPQGPGTQVDLNEWQFDCF